MSQHNNILKFEIANGIADGLPTYRIIQRIQGILETLEWDQVTVNAVPGDCLDAAKLMSTQKLVLVSPHQLQSFIDDVTEIIYKLY